MRQIVREAFLAMRDEHSPDVIIANPTLNKRFLLECQNRGLLQAPQDLNRCLLNLRKSGDLQGLKSKRVSVRNQEAFRFASEIAVRFLERKHQITLDKILCNPEHGEEFVGLASRLAPGFDAFHYRWAALSLRKRRGLRPELLGRVVAAECVVTKRADDVKPEDLPEMPGLYIFLEPLRVLYIGECQNLRKRLGKHLDHSDNKALAQWLWEHGNKDLHVEYHVLPKGTQVRVRKAMEMELIRSRKPQFNVAGTD
jgi:GIY-YIG catalytic domain